MPAKKQNDNNNNNNNILQPKTKHYEWGGPIGTTFMVLLLPTIVFAINAFCGDTFPHCQPSKLFSSSSSSSSSEQLKQGLTQVYTEFATSISQSMKDVPLAIAMLLGWYTFHSLFYLFFPFGQLNTDGMYLRDGKTILGYNINGIHAYITSLVGFALAHYFGYFNWSSLADMFIPLALGSTILAFIFSVMLYVASFRAGKHVMTAQGGNTGNPIYDFFVGRELNPRLGMLDWKFMFELRPGLIGWIILVWSFVIKASEQNFQGRYLSAPEMYPILGAALCNTIYIIDALLYEAGNVTMMDIVYDGFGFMLCFGDIAWVPFLYTLQVKFLCMYQTTYVGAANLSKPYLLLCAAVYIVGFCAFRFANWDKDRFRKNPADHRVAHLKVMKTSRGKSLIISGWWGMCRHPNYVGDWLMVVGTSMFCGVGHIMPYFQVVYFGALLVHRQLRDEQWMLEKYGKEDWETYCKAVPYRLIPKIY